MLDEAIRFIFEYTKKHLDLQPDLTSDKSVSLGMAVEEGGNPSVPLGSVGLFLINIEEERTNRAISQTRLVPERGTITVNPEIRLVLYLLFTARFEQYLSGLRYLREIVTLFQGNNVFTPREFPNLHPEIEKLILELYSLDFEQQNHLWGYLGGKYAPSLVYRARLVTIQQKVPRARGQQITHITVTGRDSSE